MRLPLRLSLPPSSSSSSSSDSSGPFVIDHDTGELLLIELQGELHITEASGQGNDTDDKTASTTTGGAASSVAREGRKVGKLDMSVPSRPTLLIGHHRLIGKVVNLTTPMAILKHEIPVVGTDPTSPAASSPFQDGDRTPKGNGHLSFAGAAAGDDSLEAPSSSSPPARYDQLPPPLYKLPKRKRGNEHAGAEVEDGVLGTDEDLGTEGGEEGEGHHSKKQTTSNGHHHRNDHHTAHLPSSPMPPSSAISTRTIASTLPPPTPANVTELKQGKHEIVGILRKKIVFSKRPEPVVKLDDESDEGSPSDEEAGA